MEDDEEEVEEVHGKEEEEEVEESMYSVENDDGEEEVEESMEVHGKERGGGGCKVHGWKEEEEDEEVRPIGRSTLKTNASCSMLVGWQRKHYAQYLRTITAHVQVTAVEEVTHVGLWKKFLLHPHESLQASPLSPPMSFRSMSLADITYIQRLTCMKPQKKQKCVF